MRSTLRALGLQVLAGLVVWLMVVAVAAALDSAGLDLPTVLLVFGQIVIVPLGLPLLRFRPGLEAANRRGSRFAAGGFLAIGALFYLLHRQGIGVGGFEDHIAQLTAIHFHFAGFGLMLMADRWPVGHARSGRRRSSCCWPARS